MKLKTSFFNTSVLKKDITRFAPLWGLYTVFMLLFLFLTWNDYSTPARFARNADEIMMFMGAVNICYAGLAALFLFGDLFKSRLCNAIHALPMRREGWFFTHLTAGLLFCIVPNALGAVISAAMLGKYAFLAYVWLGLVILQFICFFGIGIFSILCAGNGLGAVVVYGIINFLSVLVLWLAKCFYEPVLFGITFQEIPILRLSPVIAFSTQNYVDTSFAYNIEQLTFNGFISESWVYVFVAALVGIGLLVAALFMYRRRKLEAAGDFMAFQPASPVFLVLFSLCCGGVLYVMAEGLGNEAIGSVFMLIGMAIGWFTGHMLLQRRVNVFRPKAFVGLGILVFVFYLSVSIFWMDPFGVTRYVPEAQQVQMVQVAPYMADYYYGQNAAVISDPAQIERITQIHQELVDAREEDKSNTLFRIRYTLKTGVEVERTYYLDAGSENGQWMEKVYSSTQVVLGSDNLDRLKDTIKYAHFYFYGYEKYPETITEDWTGDYVVKQDKLPGLLDAIAADCQAGNMAQIWEYHRDEDHYASVSLEFSSGYRELMIYESCVNTLAYLEPLMEPAAIAIK